MSDYLFATPGFVNGMGSVLDLGGTLFQYNGSSSGEEADALAMRSDFQAVGNDLRTAAEELCNEAR